MSSATVANPKAAPGPHGRLFVAYLRVSTEKQGRSGLGLEAQQAAITAFLRPEDRLLAPPFIEVESGRNADRPMLRDALTKCRRTGATLLIAKLDRLARSVRFIATLMEDGVPFVACDLPTADPFMLHIYASVAQEEARAISRRTKAALAAAKARGVRLGGDRGHRPLTRDHALVGAGRASAARVRAADHHAHGVFPVIEEVRAELGGGASLADIAAALTARGVTTARGAQWTATAVRRVLLRTQGETAEVAP
jgi:DNA invertase Pin-like site-specific DNA recombinase